ncbi:MAG: aminotransferase class V-fold PLP-dependent enzyme [Candidatus Ranarchaeia archaeon]
MTDWIARRQDFPVLDRIIDGKRIIYFDNSCMALKPRQVIEAICYYYNELGACGGRSAHQLGFETTELCDNAREDMAKFIGARSPSEIVWTRNTTEAINLLANCIPMKEGDEILTTALEHHSGILPLYEIAKKKRLRLKIVVPDEYGFFDLEQWEAAFSNKTRLVSLVHASNLTGTIAPLRDIVKIAHDHGALVIADSAQFVPHHPVNVADLDVDFMAFSVHKMCGPTGMGVLYGKLPLLRSMDSFLVGGDTISDVYYDIESNTITPTYLPPPAKYEAGLQNYAGIIGTGAAVRYLSSIGMENISKRTATLLLSMMKKLKSFPEIRIIGPREPNMRSSLVAFQIEGINAAQDIGQYLDGDIENYRIMIRAGAHCVNPFHYRVGIQPSAGTARASLYFYNTQQEIDIFIEAIRSLISAMT